ncbi:MAG TPA: hypothetical protein VHX65_17095 [Pirellulales bacterium]|jgi:hypothetical protein|nr:hypothetical protein [Pirellulales bacterium]
MVAVWRRFGIGMGSVVAIAIGVAVLRAQAPAAKPATSQVANAPAKTPPKNAAKSDRSLIRLMRDAHGEPVALATPIIHLASKDPARAGLSVDLIGAVHVGEKSYYAKLNKQFEQYDAVLYELVSQKDVRPTPGHRSGNPISTLQIGMKNFLELQFQLDEIDYKKKNFVHADMSPEQFAKSMEDRGESIWTMMAQMWGAGIAQQASHGGGDTDLLFALFDKNRAVQLKRYMAGEMEDMEGTMGVLDGPKGSAIITERNKAALKVLGDEIIDGKKKLAIFYGAGHLADMQKRVREAFGLEQTGKIEWLEAWNLRLPGQDGKAVPEK